MIPRLKPYYNYKEFFAALQFWRPGVTEFESAFAEKFGAKYALSFPYGRSGLYTFFKAMGINDAEVIMPAYTCVVVPNATVISGNIPSFVDITLDDYNMDLDQVRDAITKDTKVIIATHLFGYPLDVNRLKQIIQDSGKDIFVVQDCAHSFACEWNGKPVCSEPDIAMYSLNISKQISAVFGGIITTDNPDIYEKMKQFRDIHFSRPSLLKQIKKFFYLIAVYFAFHEIIYGIINNLEMNGLINRFVKYYDESIIDVPKDFLTQFGDLEGRVGLIQLKKYDEIKERRIKIAEFYDTHINLNDGMKLPPIINGATYSHYVVRILSRELRDIIVKKMLDNGIQLGWLIEYCIPDMPAYSYYKRKEYPNSLYCSDRMINLPVYPDLNPGKIAKQIKFHSNN